VCLGALVYVVYMYAMYAFDVRFNPLFLVYLALFGGALYALVWSLASVDPAALRRACSGSSPARPAALFLALTAGFFYLLELGEAIPASIAGKLPPSAVEYGLPTNPVHVLDMAVLLPALGITAVLLWRRRTFGYVLAGALLTFIALLDLSLLSMVTYMVRGHHTVGLPQVVIFTGSLGISTGLLVQLLASPEIPDPSEGHVVGPPAVVGRSQRTVYRLRKHVPAIRSGNPERQPAAGFRTAAEAPDISRPASVRGRLAT
jgi:hypothetical protein